MLAARRVTGCRPRIAHRSLRIRRPPTAIVPFIASPRGFRQPHVGAIHSRWTAQALRDVGKPCVVGGYIFLNVFFFNLLQ